MKIDIYIGFYVGFKSSNHCVRARTKPIHEPFPSKTW